MQKANRKSGKVKTGDIIGYQGTSGNLGSAINKGTTVSHIHIVVRINGKEVDTLKQNILPTKSKN